MNQKLHRRVDVRHGLIVLFASLAATGAARGTHWERTFGGAERDTAESLCETLDGGYALVGSTRSQGAGEEDLWLVKTDAAGNGVWNRTFGGDEDDHGACVKQAADGGYIVVGGTKSSGAGGEDAWLIKTDTNGYEVWSKTFGGLSSDQGLGVLQTADGGYVLTGGTESFGAGRSDVFLVKTDASGKTQWNRAFGGAYGEVGCSVRQTADGGFIIAGWTESFGARWTDAYLVKTDATGRKTWDRRFGGVGSDTAYSAYQTTDGGYICVGWTDSFGAGSFDVYLIKTDSTGNELWHKTFGGGDWDAGRWVRPTTDGGCIIAGETWSFGVAGRHDVWLIKTDGQGRDLWRRTFGGGLTDLGRCVQQTKDGSYVVCGHTWSFGAGDIDMYLVRFDRGGPKVDIRANDHDGPLSVPASDPVRVTISVEAAEHTGTAADWWLEARTPQGWYHFDMADELWKRDFNLSDQRPLSSVLRREVLNRTLPSGLYVFYLGVDQPMDGGLDREHLYCDCVEVTVTP